MSKINIRAACPKCGWARGHDYGCPNDPLNPGVANRVLEAKRIAREYALMRATDEECFAAIDAIAAAPTPPVDAVLGEPAAAILLAEQVLHMEMVTERGKRARELARRVLAGHDETLRYLRLIVHATAPSPDDGGHHEAAHDLASQAIEGLTAPVASRAVQAEPAMEIRDLLCELGNGVKASNWRLAERAFAMSARFLVDQPLAAPAAPIDMVLHCPACGLQHVDAPEEEEYEDRSGQLRMKCDWVNPPHRSHLCHGCGHVWRPADIPTNGVAAVKTKGKADSPTAPAATAEPLSYCLNCDSPMPKGCGGCFDGQDKCARTDSSAPTSTEPPMSPDGEGPLYATPDSAGAASLAPREDTRLLDWLERMSCERMAVKLFGSQNKRIFCVELWGDEDEPFEGFALRDAIRAAIAASPAGAEGARS